MNSHNWSEIGSAFDELAGQSPTLRYSRLEQIRARDSRMADELSSLLNAHDSADGFFEERVDRILKSMVPGIVLGGPDVQLTAGERILHYEIVEMLGAGSIAKVYLARDTELERLIALKVTQSQNREARTLAHFSTEGIVQVHSEHVIEHRGVLLRLMCLEFIAGPTLAGLTQLLRANKEDGKSLIQLLEKFPRRQVEFEPSALKWRELLASLTLPESIVVLGIRLAEILSHAHGSGVLHLDIKPANILIDPYGRPYLSDFNVSTNTARLNAGDVQGMGGTPHYMPPEQARFFETGTADKLDARTDVFALGVVLNDLLLAVDQHDDGLNKILARAMEGDKKFAYRERRRFSQGAARLDARLRRR